MKNLLTAFLLFTAYLLPNTASAQAIKYFHDRIDTTIYATTTGTNTYTGTNTDPNFNVAGYIRGLMVSTVIVNGNTGASTYRLVTRTGTLPSVAIKKQNGAALVSGDIPDSTAILLIYYGSFWRLVGIHSASSSSWMLTGNSGTTAGTNFLGTTDNVDLVFKANTVEVGRFDAPTRYFGLNNNNPVALLDAITTGSTTATFGIGLRNSAGKYIIGSDNAGHVGINLNGGVTTQGCVFDVALGVAAADNSSSGYIASFKDSGYINTIFRLNRIRPTIGFSAECYEGWKFFGNIGMGVTPNTDYRFYSQGTGNTSATYNIVTTNSSTTNLFHVRNDGRAEAHGWLVTQPFASNAFAPSVAGQITANAANVALASIDNTVGSVLNLVSTTASAVNIGPSITGYSVYDSGLYPMGNIAFRRENGAAGNSAGYIQFATHTTATAGLTEAMRISSLQQLGVGTGSTINASAKVHISSTTQGFLMPVMTGAQGEAISSPATGLLIYATNAGSGDITSAGWWGYNGANWVKLN